MTDNNELKHNIKSTMLDIYGDGGNEVNSIHTCTECGESIGFIKYVTVLFFMLRCFVFMWVVGGVWWGHGI